MVCRGLARPNSQLHRNCRCTYIQRRSTACDISVFVQCTSMGDAALAAGSNKLFVEAFYNLFADDGLLAVCLFLPTAKPM